MKYGLKNKFMRFGMLKDIIEHLETRLTSSIKKVLNINILIILIILLSFQSCKSPTSPKIDIIPPGRRDYTWTVDTLTKIAPYNSYYFLWGTSATNLWCIGEGGDFDKMILHYDGSTWKNFSYPGQGIEPWAIFGFTADDFWVGGGEGDIFRYTNGQFNKFGDYNLNGYNSVTFYKFWGNSPTDIYVVGSAYNTADYQRYAIILHYNGTTWNYVIKPETEIQFLDIKRGTNDSPNYYLISYNDGIDSMGIYEFDGKTLKRIYYQSDSDDNIVGMFSINNDLFFGFNKKILKYNYLTSQFITLNDFNGSNIRTMSHIKGRSENDIFINMNDGIGHYNGSDIQTVFKLDSNVLFNDAVLFEMDVFFICPDPSRRNFIIVHGQLK
jgi:hypothetical protein